MARVLRRLGALVALAAAITLGAAALPQAVGAQTATTVERNTPGTLPDGDEIPSCSLFPTRLGLGRWVFTNTKDFAITLQIERADGEIVFPFGELQGGESTPEFVLTRDTVIRWAGGFYHLSAYDFVNCLDLEPPPDDVVLPTTTTAAPPTTLPAPTTTVADVVATTAPPESTTTAAEPEAEAVEVAGVVVTRVEAPDDDAVVVAAPPPLPVTGFPVGLAALGGFGVVVFGLALLAISRVRGAQEFEDQLRR